jgi:ribonuclease Z
MDHSAGVAHYFGQRTFLDNAPGNLFAPAGLVEPLMEMLRLWADIDGREPRAIIRPAVPGEAIPIRRDLVVLPFQVNHATRRRDRAVVEGLGFSLVEVRQKLLPAFEGLSGPQLVDQKKKGVQITRRVEVPLVTYCGDTAPGDFFDLPHVRDSKVLLLECTFVEPGHVGRARDGRHIHVNDLKAILPRLRNEHIVLTHLSRRTALWQAGKIVESVVGPSEAQRIAFLMDRRRERVPARREAADGVDPGPDAR